MSSGPNRLPLSEPLCLRLLENLFFPLPPSSLPSHHLISKCGANCSILSDIYWFDSLSSRLIPPALNHFAPGSGPSPGRSRRGEIMQADNASRQSITLMARTTMPLRFLTNSGLLQLSICLAGKGGRRGRADTCVSLSAPVARAVLSFCPLFSSASEHSDETTSVASVQVTGPSASSALGSPRSSCLDLFFGQVLLIFFSCVSMSFSPFGGFSFQLPATQLKSD